MMRTTSLKQSALGKGSNNHRSRSLESSSLFPLVKSRSHSKRENELPQLESDDDYYSDDIFDSDSKRDEDEIDRVESATGRLIQREKSRSGRSSTAASTVDSSSTNHSSVFSQEDTSASNNVTHLSTGSSSAQTGHTMKTVKKSNLNADSSAKQVQSRTQNKTHGSDTSDIVKGHYNPTHRTLGLELVASSDLLDRCDSMQRSDNAPKNDKHEKGSKHLSVFKQDKKNLIHDVKSFERYTDEDNVPDEDKPTTTAHDDLSTYSAAETISISVASSRSKRMSRNSQSVKNQPMSLKEQRISHTESDHDVNRPLSNPSVSEKSMKSSEGIEMDTEDNDQMSKPYDENHSDDRSISNDHNTSQPINVTSRQPASIIKSSNFKTLDNLPSPALILDRRKTRRRKYLRSFQKQGKITGLTMSLDSTPPVLSFAQKEDLISTAEVEKDRNVANDADMKGENDNTSTNREIEVKVNVVDELLSPFVSWEKDTAAFNSPKGVEEFFHEGKEQNLPLTLKDHGTNSSSAYILNSKVDSIIPLSKKKSTSISLKLARNRKALMQSVTKSRMHEDQVNTDVKIDCSSEEDDDPQRESDIVITPVLETANGENTSHSEVKNKVDSSIDKDQVKEEFEINASFESAASKKSARGLFLRKFSRKRMISKNSNNPPNAVNSNAQRQSLMNIFGRHKLSSNATKTLRTRVKRNVVVASSEDKTDRSSSKFIQPQVSSKGLESARMIPNEESDNSNDIIDSSHDLIDVSNDLIDVSNDLIDESNDLENEDAINDTSQTTSNNNNEEAHVVTNEGSVHSSTSEAMQSISSHNARISRQAQDLVTLDEPTPSGPYDEIFHEVLIPTNQEIISDDGIEIEWDFNIPENKTEESTGSSVNYQEIYFKPVLPGKSNDEIFNQEMDNKCTIDEVSLSSEVSHKKKNNGTRKAINKVFDEHVLRKIPLLASRSSESNSSSYHPTTLRQKHENQHSKLESIPSRCKRNDVLPELIDDEESLPEVKEVFIRNPLSRRHKSHVRNFEKHREQHDSSSKDDEISDDDGDSCSSSSSTDEHSEDIVSNIAKSFREGVTGFVDMMENTFAFGVKDEDTVNEECESDNNDEDTYYHPKTAHRRHHSSHRSPSQNHLKSSQRVDHHKNDRIRRRNGNCHRKRVHN